MRPHTNQLTKSVTDTDVVEAYHELPFDLVERRLAAIREYMLDAPLDVAATALHLSTVNSVMSLNTAVQAHERATIAVWDAIHTGQTDVETLGERAHQHSPDGSKHVMYYDRKAEWVQQNLLEVDYVDLADELQTNGVRACQQRLVKEVTGIKNRKAAFSLANLGFTSAACMDSVTESAFDVQNGTSEGRWSAKHPFDTVVTDTYYNRIDDLMAETPAAASQMDRYIWQWAVWAVHRDSGFTTHDPWFLLLDTVIEPDVFEP